MRVALVHDYFIQDGGAERVLMALHRLFPDAPIYTLLADPRTFPPGFAPKRLVTSPLQRLLPTSSWYPLATSLMPDMVERFDLSGYDLVLISSSSFAKGVIVPPGTRTICYLHTPTRFLWEDRHAYLQGRGWPWLAKWPLQRAFHRLRTWDHLAAQRPDVLLTNSRLSQARIRRYYQRSAEILHPPVELANIPFQKAHTGRFWLTGGRLVGYKRFDLCVEAANALQAPLKIFGEGPQLHNLKRLAGPTVEFLGPVDEATKWTLYRDAHAFLHPGVEDFGMTMLEAQASGTPVLARAAGGALEIIEDGATGTLLPTTTSAALIEAMRAFPKTAFDPNRIRAQAERFDLPAFSAAIRAYADPC